MLLEKREEVAHFSKLMFRLFRPKIFSTKSFIPAVLVKFRPVSPKSSPPESGDGGRTSLDSGDHRRNPTSATEF
jgi:hypothetical protein